MYSQEKENKNVIYSQEKENHVEIYSTPWLDSATNCLIINWILNLNFGTWFLIMNFLTSNDYK